MMMLAAVKENHLTVLQYTACFSHENLPSFALRYWVSSFGVFRRLGARENWKIWRLKFGGEAKSSFVTQEQHLL